MVQEPDEDELVALRERQHAARCRLRVAYDRLDGISDEVRAVTTEGRIATRPDLLAALQEAEHAARNASADMMDAAYALDVAIAGRMAEPRTGEGTA